MENAGILPKAWSNFSILFITFICISDYMLDCESSVYGNPSVHVCLYAF